MLAVQRIADDAPGARPFDGVAPSLRSAEAGYLMAACEKPGHNWASERAACAGHEDSHVPPIEKDESRAAKVTAPDESAAHRAEPSRTPISHSSLEAS